MHQIPTNDMEAEAGRSAVEFLMPEAENRPLLSPLSLPRLAALKPYWRVSMAALLKRAADLEVITSGQKNYLWTQMGKQGFRLKEPVDIAHEEPTVLNDIIDVHRKHLEYTIADLCQLTHSGEHDFRSRFLPSQKLRIVG